MLFTKLFKSKAAVKKVPTLHSRFCTYWLCWFLLTAHGSALAWGILVPADWLETAWAWRKMFSMASPTLQLEGQGKHTKEFSFPLIFFFWTLCTSVGDGFCVTWNHSSAQEKKILSLKTLHVIVLDIAFWLLLWRSKSKSLAPLPSVMLTKANTDSPGNESSAYVVWTMSSWSFSCVHAWNESPDLERSPLGVSSRAREVSIPSLWLTALAEAAGHPAVGVLQHRDTKRCLETFGWFHSSHTGTGLDSQAAPTDF